MHALLTILSFQETVAWLKEHVDRVLAAVAIVFAVVQFVDSRFQKRDMKEIADSMSTRFIGQFPNNMTEVVAVVRQAKTALDILVDVAAYGHYSTPLLFEEFLKEINTKRKLKVRMIVYHSDIYTKLRLEQFPEKTYEEERRSARYRKFFEANRRLTEPTTWKGFQDMLLSEQAVHLKTIQNMKVDIRTINDLRFISIWLEDRKDAVFSFQNAVEHEKEVSFRTRDGNLITTLNGVFEEAWTASEPFSWSPKS